MPAWFPVRMREAAARVAAPILVVLLLGPAWNLPARAQTASPPAAGVPATGVPAAGVPATGAQPSAGAHAPSAKTKGSAATKPVGPPSRSLPNRFAGRAGVYYKVVWGIDSLSVKWTESGEMIRFSWRVLDPQLAALLNDKKIEPALIDPQAGVSLVVPVMEKIGQLRQTQRPEAGRSYWVAFSNKGGYVKRGHRVNVAIGTFRADGLVVD
jgi:hypothetical protein